MEPTKILLIDTSHLYWSSWHATKDQNISEAYETTLARVHALRQGYEFVACCCDSPPYKRKELASSYKSNREAAPPAAVAQFERVKERLAADGVLLWGVRGYEADDIMATAVKRALALDEPVSVTIASADKDLMQLVRDPSVRMHSTMTGATIDEAAVLTKFGVKPDMIGDLLALMGDKSDGIEGVPGVGPKHAAKLLLEFGNIEGVIAGVVGAKESAVRSAVMANTETIRLARKLVTLDSSVPLNFDEIFERREVKPLREVDLNMLDDDSIDLIGPPPDAKEPAPPSEPPPEIPALVVPPREQAPINTSGETVPLSATLDRVKTNGKSEALAKALPFEMQLQPNSLAAAAALGTAIFNSRLFEKKFANPEAITAVILRGREMGLTALTACQVFHFFAGNLVMGAHLITANVMDDPDCEYFRFVEGDGTMATYETKHRRDPEPTRHTYTIDDAKQAGLCPDVIRTRNPNPGQKDERGAWEKNPASLLRKTCAVQLGRIVYPGRALGLYSAEELGGEAA